jgi:hypothetical protein
MKAKDAEDAEKQKVRRRDGYCRFPLCGCGKMRLRTEVSHSEHKGMGGNPAGDRSKADLMVLVCHRRHKDGRVAIDKGTLRWRALTARGRQRPDRLGHSGRHDRVLVRPWAGMVYAGHRDGAAHLPGHE